MWELFGYTPGVFAKSAQAIEKEGDELRAPAKERSKSAQTIGRIGVVFSLALSLKPFAELLCARPLTEDRSG